ncbi:MAG: putative tRNA pseudouridylate synthase [Streblomastix strix]|uniref:Putative tRNA pseudouridylate synthase n=1 Tax=Streblomastix strix TaxID=222440 RepID=A0A5J4VNR3_9EUKA|nr:MAG: putative tRNA pseudouridylate synthase [Streblomastix strix]
MEKNNNSTKSSFITQDSDQQAEKIQKHRVAFCIGYIGTGFSGLQYPTVRTVEGVLEHAIHQAGCISDMNAGQLTKIGWGRCARTDKGVHAAAQVVSLKLLYKDPQTIIERINNHLPPEIRVHDFQKTTARFSAKNWCNGRTYRYLIPLFAFEKGSFAGVSKIFTRQSWVSCQRIIKKISVTRSLNKPNILTSSSSSSSESSHLTASSGSSENQYDSLVVDGVPMVEIQIVGQSFIFHQIRKMIGTIIAVVRGVAPADFIDLAFSEREVPVPLAPSTGLFLERISSLAGNT